MENLQFRGRKAFDILIGGKATIIKRRNSIILTDGENEMHAYGCNPNTGDADAVRKLATSLMGSKNAERVIDVSKQIKASEAAGEGRFQCLLLNNETDVVFIPYKVGETSFTERDAAAASA